MPGQRTLGVETTQVDNPFHSCLKRLLGDQGGHCPFDLFKIPRTRHRVDEVVNYIDGVHYTGDVRLHLQVTLDYLHIALPGHTVKAMGISRKNANLLSPLQELWHEPTPDIAGSARHQDLHWLMLELSSVKTPVKGYTVAPWISRLSPRGSPSTTAQCRGGTTPARPGG